MVTIFYGNLLEDSFFFNGNLEEVLKHSYGFDIADIPSSNRMIHRGLHYSFPALRTLSLCERKKGLHPIITRDTFAHNVSFD